MLLVQKYFEVDNEDRVILMNLLVYYYFLFFFQLFKCFYSSITQVKTNKPCYIDVGLWLIANKYFQITVEDILYVFNAFK